GDGAPPFNSVEGAEPGDPNTDWGLVDPSQLNPGGYASMLPGPGQLVPEREHPMNCNWYLLALACRRGLTFLEQQPEVDPERLGVHGYSMGGNLTMYVAGTDVRVKAAVPAVGGAGWRWEWHEFNGGQERLDHVRGDTDLFRRTLSFESYAPLIRCPVLHRSATNDFHGWMDDVYRTCALIPQQPLRFSWAPHFNHRLTTEVEVAMPLWFDQHLAGGRPLPETPRSELILTTHNRVPLLKVHPDRSWEVRHCRVFYSVDPDPRARFWRSAVVQPAGSSFSAELPLHSADLPLFVFSGIDYRLPAPVSLQPLPGRGEPAETVTISGLLLSVTSQALQDASVAATLRPASLIDDFSRAFDDWYVLNRGNRSHQQIWTRKLTDPLWRGAAGQHLELDLHMPETNTLTFVIQENEWRSYRGPRKTFVHDREIRGSAGLQTVSLTCADFRRTVDEEEPLGSWDAVDQFGICAHFGERGPRATAVRMWQGEEPTLRELRWV
ncbi:MAG: alpha/beta hydrolase family protein, partial [Planctomycetota bacterium]